MQSAKKSRLEKRLADKRQEYNEFLDNAPLIWRDGAGMSTQLPGKLVKRFTHEITLVEERLAQTRILLESLRKQQNSISSEVPPKDSLPEVEERLSTQTEQLNELRKLLAEAQENAKFLKQVNNDHARFRAEIEALETQLTNEQ